MKNTKMRFIRVVAICLSLVLLMPGYASASVTETVSPQASYYLDSYNAYVYPAGSGEVQVWFHVTPTTLMTDLGALTIAIYESTDNAKWTNVKAFSSSNYTSMLGHNARYYSGHVSYQGVAGRYYKAYVCIYAGNGSGGDSRYFWTSAQIAT